MGSISKVIVAVAAAVVLVPAVAVAGEPAVVSESRHAASRVLPKGTLLRVTPLRRISSSRIKVGDAVPFRLAQPIMRGGVPVIAWGAPVKGVISWRAGRNFFGKRAKFDVTFATISAGGRDWHLSGRIRQMSRANRGAFGDMLVSRPAPAVIEPGTIFTVATAEDIPLP